MAFFGPLTFESRRPVNSWSRKTPQQVAVIVEEGPSLVRSQASLISNNFWTLLIQLAASEAEKKTKWPRHTKNKGRNTYKAFLPFFEKPGAITTTPHKQKKTTPLVKLHLPFHTFNQGCIEIKMPCRWDTCLMISS